jgi:hypothetical protein
MLEEERENLNKLNAEIKEPAEKILNALRKHTCIGTEVVITHTSVDTKKSCDRLMYKLYGGQTLQGFILKTVKLPDND